MNPSNLQIIERLRRFGKAAEKAKLGPEYEILRIAADRLEQLNRTQNETDKKLENLRKEYNHLHKRYEAVKGGKTE